MLLSGEPSMNGRDPAGHRATIATHQPALSSRAATPASTWTTRLRSGAGAASRYTPANAGRTRKACIILARNATPTSVPAARTQRVPARSSARVRQYAAATSASTSSASGLLKRNIRAATGVRANTAPPSSPAAGPNHRFNEANSRPTAATPSSAWGTSMLQLLNPKTRPERAITHSEAGGLSTVMKLDESSDPKKNAFQLFVPAW